MEDISQLAFYLTEEHPCSYLDKESSITLFADPAAKLDKTSYSQLSNLGFRRSGSNVYRPHCSACQKCIPIRIPSAHFVPNKSQKRCLKRNNDLQLSIRTSIDDDDYYKLYERYINLRHQDGDMYPASREQYDSFLTSEWGITRYLCARNSEGTLLSVAVMDELVNGMSAIYTFFEPEEHKRSLGVFSVLSQIRLAQTRRLPYVFLGYWIEESQKMAYKTQYQPYQLYINNQWRSFD